MPKSRTPMVHLAALREFPAAKTGKLYCKGRFGDATVFLFREELPYRTEHGRALYDWNLVLANDYNVIRTYHEPAPHNGGDDPEPGMKAARRASTSPEPARPRSRRMERRRVAKQRRAQVVR
jgi:hypothetical protein